MRLRDIIRESKENEQPPRPLNNSKSQNTATNTSTKPSATSSASSGRDPADAICISDSEESMEVEKPTDANSVAESKPVTACNFVTDQQALVSALVEAMTKLAKSYADELRNRMKGIFNNCLDMCELMPHMRKALEGTQPKWMWKKWRTCRTKEVKGGGGEGRRRWKMKEEWAQS